MGSELVSALELPSTLFRTGAGGNPSFSSDPPFSASSFSGCFFARLPLPERIPDYAIGLSDKGGSVFCTLVDKRRRIIVNARIGSVHGKDWDALLILIRMALRKAGVLRDSGGGFRFVLCGDDFSEVV